MIVRKIWTNLSRDVAYSLAVIACICLLLSACTQSHTQQQSNSHESLSSVETSDDATSEPGDTESDISSTDLSSDSVTPSDEALAETIYLTDYPDVGTGRFARQLKTLGRVQDNFGNYYDNAISGSSSAEWSACDYRVNKQYRYFSGRVVLNEDMRNWSSEAGQEWVSMRVYGDGNLLYESAVLEKGILPQDFRLDIGDEDVVSIEIEGQNCLRLVDAVFTNEENTADWSTMETYADYLQRVDSIPLTELYYLDSSQAGTAFIVYDTFTDADNNTYEKAIGGKIFEDDNWLLYDISGAFSTISGQVIFNPDAGINISSRTRVLIYGDGDLLYESDLVNTGVPAQDFSVDIRGINQLRVCIWGKNHSRIVNCRVNK